MRHVNTFHRIVADKPAFHGTRTELGKESHCAVFSEAAQPKRLKRSRAIHREVSITLRPTSWRLNLYFPDDDDYYYWRFLGVKYTRRSKT